MLEVLKGLDVLLINDTETNMLTGSRNLVLSARKIFDMGPKTLVVKHGEYGATPSSMAEDQSPLSNSPIAHFTRPHCRSKKWSIPPAPATALPAASSATSPRSPS